MFCPLSFLIKNIASFLVSSRYETLDEKIDGFEGADIEESVISGISTITVEELGSVRPGSVAVR